MIERLYAPGLTCGCVRYHYPYFERHVARDCYQTGDQMSRIADEVSKGNMEAPEFSGRGRDEISILAASFNRMRRSLEKAMKMLEE